MSRRRAQEAAAAKARDFCWDVPAPARGRQLESSALPVSPRLRWAVALLFLLLFAEIVFGLTGASDEFSSADGVMSVCALLALAHAGALAWCFELARRRNGGSLGGARGVSSLGSVLFSCFVLFLFIWMIDARSVAEHLNRMFGDRTVETTTVEASYQTTGKGCHFHVSVFGPTVASGTSLCLDEADWRRIAVGDHLPLVVVNARFGQSVSVIRHDSKAAE
jgi:hypothetical protein